MPRMSDSDRNRIIGEIRAGIKPSEVALRYNLHRSAVYRLMNKFTQDGDVVDRPRSGRPRVTDAREDRAMLMEHRRNPYRSAAETARATIGHHGRRISDRTVRRRLHAVGLFSRRPLRKPFMMAYHRRFRLNWAQQRQAWTNVDFRRVLFTDDVRVCADPDSGRIRIWRHVGGRHDERFIKERDRWGGVHCMVWGGMAHNVMLGPVFFNFNDGNPGKGVTSVRYVDQIILPHVRPFMQQHGNMLFMHDNAKPHTARHTVDALRQNNINVTPHPAKSPDLNPIEHFWDFLKRDMRAANVRPQNVGELRQTITQAWGRIPVQRRNTLVASMTRRTQAVIAARGGHTRY